MNNDLTGQRAALYIRVSTEEQARHGLSLDEQEHELIQFAQQHDADIVGIYRDEGTSARKNLKKRKELQRLLDDVRAGMIDIVLFIKLDRWFRNVKDFYKVQEVLDKYGVRWIATKENFNTTSSDGRFILNLFLSIAENEADKTADRIRFVLAGKKRRGEFVSGTLPIGYRIDADKKSKTYKHIVIDPYESKIVKDIFNYFLVWQSVRKTLFYARGKYGVPQTVTSVRSILKNKSYIGTFYNIKNYAPAIIDLETWSKVQTVLSQPRRINAPRTTRIYYFTGLIHCPICNAILFGKTTRQKANDRLYRYKIYLCKNNAFDKRCSFSLSVQENTVEKYLLQHIQELIREYQEVIEATETKKEDTNRVNDLQGKLTRLKDLYVNGFIDRPTYENDFKKYNSELEAVQSHHRATSRQTANALQNVVSSDFLKRYRELSDESKRAFWHSIIKEIHITEYSKGRNGIKALAVVFL